MLQKRNNQRVKNASSYVVRVIKHNPIISFIVFLAFVLRIVGIYPGYPDIHPDESTSYHTAIYLLYNFFMPDRFDYPAGVPFINALIFAVVFIPISIVRLIFLDIDALFQLVLSPLQFFIQNKEELFGNRDIYAMYWTRGITAVFGAGSVLVLYLAGKKLFTKEVGLFSAFFLAVNYLHVVRSHFGLPDVYNGFFAMLTLFACALLLEKDTRRHYLFAGICASLMFSMKYQVFGFIPFFTTHLIISIRKKSVRNLFKKDFFLSLLAAAATFLITNPYYLFNIPEAMRQNRLDVLRYRMGDVYLRPFGFFYLYHWGMGVLPSIAATVGFIVMLFSRPVRFIIVAPYAIVFIVFMTIYSQGGIFTRNFANVMPYLMLFAGYGVYVVFAFMKRQNLPIAHILIVVLLLWINFVPLQNSYALDRSYAQPWNIYALGDWLKESLPDNVSIRNYQLFIRQNGQQAILDKKATLKDWDYSKGPNSLAEFQEEGTQFAILNTEPLQSITYWWRGWEDPKIFLTYKTVPYDFIENDFYGLSVKELLRYTVFETYKPWQAHNEHNYLVFKIPPKPKTLGKLVKEFHFDRKEDQWEIRGIFPVEDPIITAWSPDNGHVRDGALTATASGVRSRIVSQPVPVTAGKQYSVEGYIKTVSTNQGERDGFLRLDFYKNETDALTGQLGMAVAISPRTPATGKWIKEQVSMVAPIGAAFMTVGFQFKETSFSSQLDDVSIFETDIMLPEPFPEVPYITPSIPIESIYYNTFI